MTYKKWHKGNGETPTQKDGDTGAGGHNSKDNNRKMDNIWNGCKHARKGTQVQVLPRDVEEDGGEGHKEPKDQSLRIGCILGSPSLKKNH